MTIELTNETQVAIGRENLTRDSRNYRRTLIHIRTAVNAIAREANSAIVREGQISWRYQYRYRSRDSHRSVERHSENARPIERPKWPDRGETHRATEMCPYLLYSSENHMIHAGLLGGRLRDRARYPQNPRPRGTQSVLRKKTITPTSPNTMFTRTSQEPRATGGDVKILSTVPRVEPRDRVSPMRPRYRLSRAGRTIRESFCSFRETTTVLSLIS